MQGSLILFLTHLLEKLPTKTIMMEFFYLDSSCQMIGDRWDGVNECSSNYNEIIVTSLLIVLSCGMLT